MQTGKTDRDLLPPLFDGLRPVEALRAGFDGNPARVNGHVAPGPAQETRASSEEGTQRLDPESPGTLAVDGDSSPEIEPDTVDAPGADAVGLRIDVRAPGPTAPEASIEGSGLDTASVAHAPATYDGSDTITAPVLPNVPALHPDETGGPSPAVPDAGDPHPAAPSPLPQEDLDGRSLEVTQSAAAFQDACLAVKGYVGEVVARLHIQQDLDMDQDVDVLLGLGGGANFDLLLEQVMRIDQSVEIDVEIFDLCDVLYVDVFVRDAVAIEQDTVVDIRLDDGSPGVELELVQDVELNQDVDIDIDIKDELESRYDVQLDVDVTQQVDAVQDASVRLAHGSGWTDFEVEADQVVTVGQQTTISADFVLV